MCRLIDDVWISSVFLLGLGGVPEKPHTLEDYAVDHFRPPPKRTMSKGLTLTSASRRSKSGGGSVNGASVPGLAALAIFIY